MSGSVIFSDADGYQARLGETFDLLVVPERGFRARLTEVGLPRLRLIRAHEGASRVAHLSLPTEVVFFTFITHRGASLVYNGAELAFGQMIFHSRAEHFHQRTIGTSRWGTISLSPAHLMSFGRVLTGRDLDPPSLGRILHPRSVDRTRLLRLHAQAGRIAETQLNNIWHPEVARALEHELIWALVICLTCGHTREEPAVNHQDAEALARFEDVLATHPGRTWQMAEICSAVGVSEDAFRVSCLKALGMDPTRYTYLRRLKLARLALMRPDSTTNVAEVMQRFGFTSPERFNQEYTEAYGDVLSALPRRSRDR